MIVLSPFGRTGSVSGNRACSTTTGFPVRNKVLPPLPGRVGFGYDSDMKALAVVGLLLIAAALLHAQIESKPEDGFVSPKNYTNAFLGFSVPFPSDVQLTLLKESSGERQPYRHVLFGANSQSKGYPVFVVLADEIALSRTTDPKEALSALGAQNVRKTSLGGRDFATGQSKSEGIYQIYYATAVKGYMLYFSVFAYDKKVLENFQHSIEAIEFFDPATAKQHAGPDSRPYDGPPRG